jgi:hypothetical protein
MNGDNRARRTHLNGSAKALEWKPSEVRGDTSETQTPFGTTRSPTSTGMTPSGQRLELPTGKLIKGCLDGGSGLPDRFREQACILYQT